MKLHTRLFFALILGIILGAALHSRADTPWIVAVNVNLLRPIGQIFLRSIFMIVVPMVFSALVIGVYDLGRGHEIAGVAGRTLGFTVVLSTLSVVIGLVLVNLVRPGDAFPIQAAPLQNVQSVQTLQAQAAGAKSIADTLVELIPRNPIETAVRALDGDMLQLMIFALIFGVATSAIAPKQKHENVLIRLLEQVFDACMWIVHAVMKLAPVAVFAIIFNTAFTFGTGVFASLFLYVATVVAGLLLQQFGVYSAMLALVARRSPVAFFQTVPRGVSLRLLDGFVECDASAIARGRRNQASPSARYLPIRADRGRDSEPERHGAVRRDYGAVSRAGLRARSDQAASRCA